MRSRPQPRPTNKKNPRSPPGLDPYVLLFLGACLAFFFSLFWYLSTYHPRKHVVYPHAAPTLPSQTQ